MNFLVVTTSRFDRELKKLAAKHPALPVIFGKAVGILSADPFNASRNHAIRKVGRGCRGRGPVSSSLRAV
jgi:hypothetical protein